MDRKRTRRACDRCSASRTKCDGGHPCRRCVELGLECQYARTIKKRGKGSDLYPRKKRLNENSSEMECQREGNETSDPDNQRLGGSELDLGLITDGDALLDALLRPEFAPRETNERPAGVSNDPDRTPPSWPSDKMPKSAAGQDSPVDCLKFPVLLPILPVLLSFIPLPLAETLLEHYFQHHVYSLASIIRRTNVLASSTRFRPCTPALLYSVLMISASVIDHPQMRKTPATRQLIVGRLHELTTEALDSIHTASSYQANQEKSQPLLQTRSPRSPYSSPDSDVRLPTIISATPVFDDVVAVIHLGIVESASERKGSSMRWWMSAMATARVLRLNREIQGPSLEHLEERRRAWWTLFMLDRHLALCYHRPLILAESECLRLRRPVDGRVWDSDRPLTEHNAHFGPTAEMDPSSSGLQANFLPLMTVLGTIVDLHFHELDADSTDLCQGGGPELVETVRSFALSRLDALEASVSSVADPLWRGYAKGIVHVLYVLAYGFWDPTMVLDNSGNLKYDTNFVLASRRAVQASQSLEQVLTLDPEFRLIPFLLGIYLVHAGTMLISSRDARACELLVRCQEVCIATLDTQYQRNFRTIIRRALAGDTEGVRRLLDIYDWSAGGNGVAV